MNGPMCRKGKSCGATCIDARERCNIELGPLVSPAVSKVATNLGAIFMRGIDAGKQERLPSVPSDMKRELAALNQPRQLERSPGARTRTAPAVKKELAVGSNKNEPDKLYGKWETNVLKEYRNNINNRGRKGDKEQVERVDKELARREAVKNGEKTAKKGSTDRMLDDISRIMRGSLPREIKTDRGANNASGDTKWARQSAEDFDKTFKIYKRIRGDEDTIDWNETIRNGKAIGEGSFGSVLKLGNTAVKRGEISGDEANIIKRVGDAGIGPKLRMAEISSKVRRDTGVDIHNGRIAMSVVPGKQMGDINPDTKFAGKNAADVYWKSLADLHRLGIAHNDAHIANILVDDKGKGRWVDMGYAQQSPKAALSEALGSFSKSKRDMDGNWQTAGWDATGIGKWRSYDASGSKNLMSELKGEYPVFGRVISNKDAVQSALLGKYGFSRKEVDELMDHGIRNDLDSYNQGPWKKLSDKQAQDLLNIMYDGI